MIQATSGFASPASCGAAASSLAWESELVDEHLQCYQLDVTAQAALLTSVSSSVDTRRLGR